MAPTAERTVSVELRGAAWTLMNCTDPEVLVSGPAGTGKTVGALLKVHLSCLGTPGVRALIVRKWHSSLTGSTLVHFRRKVAAEAIAMGHVRWYGGSGSEPAQFRYANGSAVVVGGLDRPSKLLSSEYDLILVDEATETVPDDLDVIITRLRNGVLPYQQLIMLCNPDSPTHHLKQRADAGRSRMLYSRHQDNPRYFDPAAGAWTPEGVAYLDILRTLPEMRRRRFLEGLWTAAEGLVYEEFSPSVHVTSRFGTSSPPPPEWPRWLSVDFGYRNPFTCQWWAADPDGALYLYREIYKTETLVEDHAKVIGRLLASEPKARPPQAIICDHDAEDRATLERHLGRATVAAKKDVLEGIQAVQERLRVRANGKPGLFICGDTLAERDAKLEAARKPMRLLDEITGYVWDDRPVPGGGNSREAPVKADDHAADAMRYLVAQVDLKGRPRFRSFYT
jgi:hypothetical protein